VLTAPVGFPGLEGGARSNVATGRLWIEDAELNPLDVDEGRAPRAAGEIAVDRGTAERKDLEVGQRVQLATADGVRDRTIVGFTRFGDNDALDQSGTVSSAPAAATTDLHRGQDELESLYLRGASPDELREAVAPLLPKGFEATTGDDFRAEQRDSIGSIGRALRSALQAFALLALLVGGFVIYNTFSVIVAQRLRELAVLAAIGATPKQIKRALRYEGLAVGLIGSVLGVLAAIVMTLVLVQVLKAVGVSLPGSGLSISGPTVFQCIVLGTLITLVSVTLPARRAAKTEPIEALRQSATESAHVGRRRKIIAAALCGLGLLGLLAGGSAPVVGLGGLALFIGVIVAGPMIARLGARLALPVMRRFGLEGRLAVDNTVRSPQRTATTANALLIGVFLVTLVTVAGTSVKDFAVSEIQKVQSADYVVKSDGGTIDPALIRSFEGVDGVASVAPFRTEPLTIDGTPTPVSSGDIRALQSVSDLDTTEGSLADVGPGAIALVEDGDKRRVGQQVRVETSDGKTQTLRVAAVLKASIDASIVGGLVAPQTLDALVGQAAPTVAFVDAEEGAQTKTQDGVEDIAAARPDVSVSPGNAIGKIVGQVFDFVIDAVNGLLVMSVVIALIGIINTLSLSILERRRELGLLRIVGMTDDRVRKMVRLESMLIAALGTVSGVLLGLVTAWGMIFSIDRLSDAGIGYGFPVTRLVLVLVLGVALGVLAALIPARRSTRLDPLDAVQAT
jgi:putative ABC transport system permease protein